MNISESENDDLAEKIQRILINTDRVMYKLVTTTNPKTLSARRINMVNKSSGTKYNYWRIDWDTRHFRQDDPLYRGLMQEQSSLTPIYDYLKKIAIQLYDQLNLYLVDHTKSGFESTITGDWDLLSFYLNLYDQKNVVISMENNPDIQFFVNPLLRGIDHFTHNVINEL